MKKPQQVTSRSLALAGREATEEVKKLEHVHRGSNVIRCAIALRRAAELLEKCDPVIEGLQEDHDVPLSVDENAALRGAFVGVFLACKATEEVRELGAVVAHLLYESDRLEGERHAGSAS